MAMLIPPAIEFLQSEMVKFIGRCEGHQRKVLISELITTLRAKLYIPQKYVHRHFKSEEDHWENIAKSLDTCCGYSPPESFAKEVEAEFGFYLGNVELKT